jgi:hypothetical protein
MARGHRERRVHHRVHGGRLARDPAGHDEPALAHAGDGRARPVGAGQRDDELAVHASTFRSICCTWPSRWAA